MEATMEEKLNLKDIFLMVKKHFAMIGIITTLAIIISGTVSLFVLQPVYQSSTQILVNQSNSENPFDVNQVKSNLELINTYNVIIKSPIILEYVIEEQGLELSYEALFNQVSVHNQDESQVVVISVENENPATAVRVANSIATVFQERIVDIMKVDNVSILSPAVLKKNPQAVKPQPVLNMIIAGLAGFFISIGISFTREYFDNTIKSEVDIEQKLNLPSLGAITKMKDTDMNKLSKIDNVKKKEVGGKVIES